MTTVEQIILLFSKFVQKRGLSESRVSTLIFNRGSKIRDLKEGGDLTTRWAEQAFVWFSTNWPADLDWPEGVPRPAPVSGVIPLAPADCPPVSQCTGGAFPEAAA